MKNPFEKKTGAQKISNPLIIGLILMSLLPLGYFIANGGLANALLIIVLPFAYFYLYTLFSKPIYGIWTLIVLSYVIIGLLRYVSTSIPLGLSVDAILVMTILAIFFKGFYEKVNWKPLNNPVFYAALVWMGYTVFEFFNPESNSTAAWFYAMRGPSLYFLLTILVTFMLLRKVKYLNTFFYLWGFFALLAALKGIMQQHIGVDPFEQRWLDAGAKTTHVLFGKLRVFSFLSDAGQFGAASGHAAVIGLIVGLNTKKYRDKIFFLTIGVLSLYGMMISGTRGAIAIPFGGAIIYFLMKRNFKILAVGFFMMIGVFIFFKYTTIGNSNYTINRMRTAFDPNDASLQVRKRNQRMLKGYLSSRPFGGGVGSSGHWGQRFTPGHILAETPTDSWYVKIWVENGIIGLLLHIGVLFFILGYGLYTIWTKVTDKELAAKLTALGAGMFGVMIAGYGNPIVGQLPTGPLLYVSMAAMAMGGLYNEELLTESIDSA